MREIQNIDQTIGFMKETNAVEVTLQANQYRLDKLTQYQHFLAPGIRMLSGEIIEATEEKLVIRYKKKRIPCRLNKSSKRKSSSTVCRWHKNPFLNGFSTPSSSAFPPSC